MTRAVAAAAGQAVCGVGCAVLLVGCSDYTIKAPGEEAGRAVPQIEVVPDTVDFGTLELGCEARRTLTVRNVGEAPLTVDDLSWSTDGAITGDAWSGVLAAGAEREVFAWFLPVGEGRDEATLQVVSDDPDRPVLDVPLGGLAIQATATDTFIQPDAAIDVLWVVDNSGSMGEEQARVIADIEAFFTHFSTLALDYQVGVVTTDIVTPTMAGRLQGEPPFITPATTDPVAVLAAALDVGTDDMGDESGLAAIELALSEPLASAENAGFHRPDAWLEIVILSDEPEQSGLDAAYYIDFLEDLKPDRDKVHVSTIVGDRETGCTTTCDGAESSAQPGDAYLDVALAFDGVTASICTCDLGPELDEIGNQATLFFRSCPLSTVPVESDAFDITVDGAPIEGGYVYDADANMVVFETPPAPGAEIVITYPVPPTCP
ncbi:MAG: hypothetical protein H6742_11905 [Alphaproteobacteria bacterium]|nr:hypothetical protein [Alphaproteobacteria bacterium]